MQVDDPKRIADELVQRCKGDASLIDKVLEALQKQIRQLTILNILKGN